PIVIMFFGVSQFDGAFLRRCNHHGLFSAKSKWSEAVTQIVKRAMQGKTNADVCERQAGDRSAASCLQKGR
ncbi:MAG TPA: hypothetical protein V6C98_16510, partial [Thermosynechococcaceae cyanobacterium]